MTHLPVRVGIAASLTTALIAGVFVSSLYLQEWIFDSEEAKTHAPATCNVSKILAVVLSRAPDPLRVAWLCCTLLFTLKHIFFASLYDRIYSGLLNEATLALRVLGALAKATECSLFVAVSYFATYHPTSNYTDQLLRVFVGVMLVSMVTVLLLEFATIYTRIKHRGYYNTGSFNCKLVSLLALLGLWLGHHLCTDCCSNETCSAQETCRDVALATSFMTIPVFLVFHGTDCLDFIKLRCFVRIPWRRKDGYQRMNTGRGRRASDTDAF